MDKHTPGPLEAVGNLVRTSMATGGFLVAEFRDANGQPYSDEAKANASLFAAAPELLEALDKLTDVYAAMRVELVRQYPQDGWSTETMTLDAAHAALSKARGEQV